MSFKQILMLLFLTTIILVGCDEKTINLTFVEKVEQNGYYYAYFDDKEKGRYLRIDLSGWDYENLDLAGVINVKYSDASLIELEPERIKINDKVYRLKVDNDYTKD